MSYPPKAPERRDLVARSLRDNPCEKCESRMKLTTSNTMDNTRCPECHSSLRQRWQVQRTTELQMADDRLTTHIREAVRSGSTVHAPGCGCGFCEAGWTRL